MNYHSKKLIFEKGKQSEQAYRINIIPSNKQCVFNLDVYH
jgi:hypothetical protein